MNNIFYWNVRGLNRVQKQELASSLLKHNISLFNVLEVKVKGDKHGHL